MRIILSACFIGRTRGTQRLLSIVGFSNTMKQCDAEVDEKGVPLLSAEARFALKQMNIEDLFEHQHTALSLGRGGLS